MTDAVIDCRATIERKSVGLPRYVVIPGEAMAPWQLDGTTVVELSIDGRDVGRRSIKRWGKGVDDWFMDIPDAICRRLGLDTGQQVRLTLTRASEALPEAIASLVDGDAAAARAWSSMTAAEQRAVREHVLAAKQPQTRRRRAGKALLQRSQRGR